MRRPRPLHPPKQPRLHRHQPQHMTLTTKSATMSTRRMSRLLGPTGNTTKFIPKRDHTYKTSASANFSHLWTPSLSCPHLDLIYKSHINLPYFFCCLGTPPRPHTPRTSYKFGPKRECATSSGAPAGTTPSRTCGENCSSFTER